MALDVGLALFPSVLFLAGGRAARKSAVSYCRPGSKGRKKYWLKLVMIILKTCDIEAASGALTP